MRPYGLSPTRLLCPWDSPGKNTEVSNRSLFQGIFPTQGLKLGLLNCRQILYHSSHQRSLIFSLCVCVLSCFSCVRLCNTVNLARQTPLSMGFSRHQYWNGLPCPPPGDLPNSGVQSMSPLTSPAVAGRFLNLNSFRDIISSSKETNLCKHKKFLNML